MTESRSGLAVERVFQQPARRFANFGGRTARQFL
jgi:hypothetical protein